MSILTYLYIYIYTHICIVTHTHTHTRPAGMMGLSVSTMGKIGDPDKDAAF